MKNLVFNLRTAKAQAEGCAKVTKSSRMAKILTTLTLLLTLGVGEMWAANYILGPDGSWTQNSAHELVSSGITYWQYKNLTPSGRWTNFKIYKNGTWYGKDSGGNDVTIGVEYTPTTSGGDAYCDFTANYSNMSYYFFFNTSTNKLRIHPLYYLAGTCSPKGSDWDDTQNPTTYDATNGYFKCSTKSLSANTEYAFKFCGHDGNYWFDDWSGVTVTQGTKTSNNSGDIKFKSTYAGTAVITLNPTNNNMVIHCPYQISYNPGDYGSGSISAGSKTWKINFTLSSSTFTRTGYTQDGWSTSDGGSKVYNLGGSYTTDADLTLYPHWTAKQTTITLNGNSGTGGSASVVGTYGNVLPSFTKHTREGYKLDGYYTDPSTGTKIINADGTLVASVSGYTDASNKWARDNTTGITLYAHWLKTTVTGTMTPNPATANTTTTFTFNVTFSNWVSGQRCIIINPEGGFLYGPTAINNNSLEWTSGELSYNAGSKIFKLRVCNATTTDAITDDYEITLTVAAATYPVTVGVSPAGYGTVSPTSASASPDSWSGDITATPNAGYRFVNWTSSGGGITINNNTSATTQIKATSTGGTLTANFSAATYRVTLNNQSATTTGTTYVDATYNTTTLTTIIKPTKTNYTFGGYYTATDGGGTQIIDANGNWLASKSGFTDSSKKSIITENKNLYAKWTETKYAVTVAVDDASHTTGDIDCSATGWVAGTSGTAQIGNLTNVNITAGAAAPGYKFDGGYWTLTGGVTLISGSLTSPAITVKATAAGSAIFTYAEDLSTSYVINGGSAFGGSDPWWNQNIPFTKKSGESTGTIAYAEIPISATVVTDVANANYNFKVVKKGVSDVWYGLSGGGDWWYSSSSGEQTMVVDNQNIQLRANVVGTYTVKLDYTTPASPKITITWPVALSIYRSNPTDGTNIGDHAWASMPSSTSYRWNLDLEDNTTYEFKINDKGAYYGNNTDITTSVSNRIFATGTNDTKLITKSAGRFVITYNSSGHTVTVVYPKSAAISASPASVYTGGTTTLTGYASELGSGSHTITYEFYKGTELTPANLIASKSKTESATYQQETQDVTVNFDGNTTSQIYTIQIKEGGSILATNTVTVYRKWDIYVHDVASWNAMKLYMYSEDGLTHNEEWPGPDCSNYNGSTTWYTVPLDAKYDRFILNNGTDGKKQTHGGDGALQTDITTYTPGTFWYVSDGSLYEGTTYYGLTKITISAPTVTLSATVTNTNQINLTGNITNCGGDGMFASDMKEVYFNVNNIKDAADITVGTTTALFTKTLNNPTPDNTNNTLQAAATNIGFTGTSSAIRFSRVTLDKQSGSDGTSTILAVNGASMASGATAPGKTGYTFGGYYASTGGSGKQYYNASMGSANNWDQTTATKTIYAKWTPITYTVHFNGNGNTGGSMNDQTGVTYDSETTLTANAFERTGYNFAGWATTEERANAGTVDRTDGAVHGNLASTQGATAQLWAVWTPKTCTVTFDYQSSAEGYAGAGTLSNVTATYNAAMPALTGNMPTAAQGYAFMGFYSETGGNGTLYYNPDKTSAHNWDVDTESTTTLYAYYKKAEITDITLNASIFEPVEADADPKAYVTADPVIAPTPTLYTKLCWELRYSNDNPVTGHDPISVSGNQVKFLLNGLAAGGYKIHVELRTGSTCGAGELLSSFDKSFSIASDHIVTIQYKCGDFTLKAPTSVGGKPLDWSDDITAESIDGYAFSSWTAGDGVTIKDSEGEDKTTSTEATIKIKANYDGTLTANYTKKRMIYFYNTLGWSGVTVYFYKNDSYWGDSGQGTGANTGWAFTDTPYSEGKHGDMTQIEGTDIWFFDCEAASVPSNYENIVFTEINQHGCDYFYNNNKVVRRGDYKTSLPMFVPLANQTPEDKNGGTAKYYNKGYWMNYPENTGYTLRIYSSSGASEPTRTIRFPFSNDKKMPLKLDVEFNEAATSYYYTIYREDGTVLSADYGMNTNYHSDVRLNDPSKKISIKTTAPGIYTFTLVYKNTPNLDYYISVDYPIVANDYRILYSDNATWSQGSAHTAGWSHPSDVIRKNTDAEVTQYDTVSFYIAKGDGITASMKFQYASEIVEAGTITWTDVTGGAITIPSSVVTKPGVYNFIIKQVGTADPVVEKVEPYTGNYYIRTDNAGSTKWDYYRSSDHQMTYTEFSMSDANSFGEKYSHYFAAWCVRGTNIKFCIANDYSSCISDTLSQDVGNPFDNTDTGGTLKSDGAGDPLYDRYSANVRFMYNQETNKISRAYVASSTNLSRLFLVLRGDEVVKAEDGSTELNDQGVSNGAILNDKENWIYERILYIKPNAKFKLFASYALLTPGRMDSVQYFRGAYVSGDSKASATFSDGSYVILISGTGGYQKARVIYDFKTNRLVCAWLPSDEPIDETLHINADVMVIRDHQEAAECITFSGSGSLTQVKTVYGAMKFNRWTLNNRYRGKGGVEDNNKAHCDSPEDIAEYHGILPAGEQKSVYERSLYFISFPFDVKVSEIFGFGTYGKHWVLEYYDGLNRAKNGYWIDSPANWKYVTPSMAKTYELKAYEGYILCLSLGRMAYDNTEVWPNNISNVELYFPSKVPMGNIQTTNVTIPGLSDEYRCTINREGEDGDRRVKDSYWRCLGVPSYNLYAGQLKEGEGGSTINWQTNYNTFPFLYAWNMTDNTLTPQATNAFSFKPMHAYLTQIGTAIYWTNVSATPASVIARQVEEPAEYNWRLTLNNGEDLIDQTYVRMSTDEVITNEFDFGQDLSKELNTGRSDIYSFIGNERAAANSMQMNTETTTIVPLGLNIEATGDYTFSIPDGTNGIGITLIDEETGIRTSLSALDYTVELAAGDYTERFWLEISPVQQTPTGIEEPTSDSSLKGRAQKRIIDGVLYIVKDGKLFDARGTRVE